MKLGDERKLFVEVLSELNIEHKTIVKIEVYLKQHNINLKEYLIEVRKNKPEELTDGRLMDIALSIYEGNLFDSESKELSMEMYKKELKIREKYHNLEDKKLEKRELEENKKWYIDQLNKLKAKYHRK
ncbi:MAG: hypothetical protein IJI58_02180 [Bacilli bacterium]|nr:hypothetical protein [Bacilli bacterium]